MGSKEMTRKPKLFFVSTSATTSTLQTASICYVSSATIATCTGRKRRTISLDGGEPEEGGEVPALLDHHHVHLHLDLLHHHIHRLKRTLHTGGGEHLWLI